MNRYKIKYLIFYLILINNIDQIVAQITNLDWHLIEIEK
tara:strand:- start:863 stop:979 length:117 start_codon:yes stop_codon:yes gene_type:complete